MVQHSHQIQSLHDNLPRTGPDNPAKTLLASWRETVLVPQTEKTFNSVLKIEQNG